MKKKFIYPQLSVRRSQDLAFFRLGGPGLANCLFVAARAHLRSKREGGEVLRPTWERFGLGQWIRHEKDKRLYYGLFKDEPFLQKVRRFLILRFCSGVVVEEGLAHFFEDLLDDYDDVVSWFYDNVEPSALSSVPQEMKKSIAVHIRLGDFPQSLRQPMSWYRELINCARSHAGRDLDVQIFSDGEDEELVDVLSIPGTRRVFYGNALADIVAISRCGLLIAGSYSTFATWGAFLGQVPCVLPSIDYGRILCDSSMDARIGSATQIPESICQRVFR